MEKRTASIYSFQNITIMDDEFNLGVLTMRTPEGEFVVDFDKE